ncbi:hypothetical protein [Psychroserpens sp. SPM9]|uniref:hypothetical protein n=1 Tax=Psychroserpens sp. SPM9 TaxID=2975598 RepID=UPI0021A61C6D|nr:hypothetical protein [Psychroserpens sp. SPM9]MDG5490885.1 hypothetical protein [Psychroserpens sp. SPM9]
MNQTKFLVLFLILPIITIGQDRDLSAFRPLVDKTWVAEGKWENGTEFKQEVNFHYDLDNSIVIANSKGFVNQEQTKYGPRNHGVRQYDKASKSFKFWEFDVFGNVTTGTVVFQGKNILYHYKYGDLMMTDMWEYVDESIYNFKVGIYANGNWEQYYLNTVFKAKK